MGWRRHMKSNVTDWLTKGDRTVSLDENFLMLFGNPYLFQEGNVSSLFSEIEPSGTFYRASHKGQAFSYCHPLFGAPMVAMYTEILAELGVRNIVACGYVGGLGAGMEIGSYAIPTAATGLDGCTKERFPQHASFEGSAAVVGALQDLMGESGARFQSGKIVSIDALMLENDRMIQDFREQGFQAIDLETACLYSLGAHLGMQVASLHIVSDNPVRKWIDPGRHHEASFGEQVKVALEALGSIAGRSNA